MVSYPSVSSGVLKRIKTQAKVLAEIEYCTNKTKNKSAFVSRHAGRHYERLLKSYYEDAEKRRLRLQIYNKDMKAEIARLRLIVSGLQKDIEFQGLLRKLGDNVRNEETFRVFS